MYICLCTTFYGLSALVGCRSSVSIRRIIYKYLNVCPFDYTAVAVSGMVEPSQTGLTTPVGLMLLLQLCKISVRNSLAFIRPLTHIKQGLQKYCETAYLRSGTNQMCGPLRIPRSYWNILNLQLSTKYQASSLLIFQRFIQPYLTRNWK